MSANVRSTPAMATSSIGAANRGGAWVEGPCRRRRRHAAPSPPAAAASEHGQLDTIGSASGCSSDSTSQAWLSRRALLLHSAAASAALASAATPLPAAASKLPEAVDRAWEGLGGGPADLVFPGAAARGAAARCLCLCAGWPSCASHGRGRPAKRGLAAHDSPSHPPCQLASLAPPPAELFLGVWDVDSVLTRVDLPLGPEFVPDMRVRALCAVCAVCAACVLRALCVQRSFAAVLFCAFPASPMPPGAKPAWCLPSALCVIPAGRPSFACAARPRCPPFARA